MKLIGRFLALSSALLALGIALFGTTQPVLAGCNAQFDIDSVTAYRDHITINFTYDTAASSPINFTVSDGKTQVGSGTFSSPVPGSFSLEFDLNASVVQELDSLDIEGTPSLGCPTSAIAAATGLFYTAGGAPRIRPECPDGRINYNNCDKIAIYPVKDEDSFGIQVYVVDHKAVPEFVLFVSAADLDVLPANPDKVIVIAQSTNGLVVLYKHPNGDYQINYGPDFEGKVFTFRFSGLPATSYPEVTTFMVGALSPRLTVEIG
jgi:hypothetical protein